MQSPRAGRIVELSAVLNGEGGSVKRLVIVATLFASLAFAGQAMAGNTYTVLLGQQGPTPAGVVKSAFLDQFLPSKVTINAGDTVTFSSASFHTVSYAPKPPALFVPDPAKGKYASLNDAAGIAVLLRRAAEVHLQPPGVRAVRAEDDLRARRRPRAVCSRRPARRRSPRRSPTPFPKAGTYKLFCNVHPGMKGTVVVKPAGGAVPMTPAQVRRAGASAEQRRRGRRRRRRPLPRSRRRTPSTWASATERRSSATSRRR